MRYEVKELGVGGILDQGIGLVKNHFGLLLGIVGAVFIPVSLIGSFVLEAIIPQPASGAGPDETVAYFNRLLELWPLWAVIVLVNWLVIFPWTQAAITRAIATLYLGGRTSVGGALGKSAGRIPALIGTWILMYLAVIVGSILIIPGIIFALWFSLATQVVVLEKLSGTKALGRSRQLMKGNMGKVFALYLILTVIGFGIYAVAGFVPNVYLSIIIQVLAQAVMTLLSAAVFVVLYFSARCQHESFDLDLLAAEVEGKSPVTEGIDEAQPVE